MKYETILFDLDGTLTDPGVGITNSVAYALLKFGITVPERKRFYPLYRPALMNRKGVLRVFGRRPAARPQVLPRVFHKQRDV